MKPWIIVAALVALSACTNMTMEAKDAAEAAKRAQYETREAWKRLLTYTPPPKPPLAQRRYCYKQLSDVVCYDTEQQTTSPLVAIQEGNPGRLIGGKVEYEDHQFSGQPAYASSTGAAMSDRVIAAPLAPAMTYNAPPPMAVQQRNLTPVGVDGGCVAGGPFPCKESNYVTDPKAGN